MFWYSVVLCLLFLLFDDVVTQPFTCVPLVVGEKVEDTTELDELHSDIEPDPYGDKSEEIESDDEERNVFLDYLRFADSMRTGLRVGEIAPPEIGGRLHNGGSDPLPRDLRSGAVGGVRVSVTPPGWKAAQHVPGLFDEKSEQVRESILGLPSHRHPELRLRRNTLSPALSNDDVSVAPPPKLGPSRRRPSHLTLDFSRHRNRSIFAAVDSPDDVLSFSPISPEVGGVGASGANAGRKQTALLDLIVERLSPVEDSSRKSLSVIGEAPGEVAAGRERRKPGAPAIAQEETATAAVPTKEAKSHVSGFKQLLPSKVFEKLHGKSGRSKKDSNGNWASRFLFRGRRGSLLFPQVRKGVRFSLPHAVSNDVRTALANKGLVTGENSRAEGEGGTKGQGSLSSTLVDEPLSPTTPPELEGDDSPKPVHGNSADEELKGNENPGAGRRNSVEEELKGNESPKLSRRNIADEESKGKKKLGLVHPNSVDPEPNEGEGTILRSSQLEREPEGEISQPPAGDSSSQNNQVEASAQKGSPNNSSKWPRLSRYFHVASRIVPIIVIVGLVTAGFVLLGVWLHKKKKRGVLFKKASKRSNAILQQRIKMRSEAKLQNLANT